MTVTIELRECKTCNEKTMQCVSTGKKGNDKWVVTVCNGCMIVTGFGINSTRSLSLVSTEG